MVELSSFPPKPPRSAGSTVVLMAGLGGYSVTGFAYS